MSVSCGPLGLSCPHQTPWKPEGYTVSSPACWIPRFLSSPIMKDMDWDIDIQRVFVLNVIADGADDAISQLQ